MKKKRRKVLPIKTLFSWTIILIKIQYQPRNKVIFQFKFKELNRSTLKSPQTRFQPDIILLKFLEQLLRNQAPITQRWSEKKIQITCSWP